MRYLTLLLTVSTLPLTSREFFVRFRVNTSTRCFFTEELVLLIDDVSEGVYAGGAACVVVDVAGVLPEEALVFDEGVEDMVM